MSHNNDLDQLNKDQSQGDQGLTNCSGPMFYCVIDLGGKLVKDLSQEGVRMKTIICKKLGNRDVWCLG